ncbi:protein phosphatase 2C domain-containing protein [Cytobacillus massiliigabonensis]|uniref:protein phosphatase 2C domain-containing protein n=1 Tax=Cytobacillus massiliigabonensis TaxID=1871011 RepID=UPI000C846BD4|nr:protein phosphatase 2C domain-containing protein [Cytobacillus massiliigabonensis]
MNTIIKEFTWVGSQEHFVDKIDVQKIQQIIIGRFGGNSTAGQDKNEDGCLIWVDDKEEWEFAIILDAHHTTESAEIVIETFSFKKTEIATILSMPVNQCFKRLEAAVLDLFQGEKFLSACQKAKGETACLIVARKNKYVWWFSVGDCSSYIFHPELASLGQYQMNQRQFFEWVGQVNTFVQTVPCYSSGIRELRRGSNRIFLTTDGLIECPNEPFSNPKEIDKILSNFEDEEGIKLLLQKIQDNHVRDSTTIISWKVSITNKVTRPSNE